MFIITFFFIILQNCQPKKPLKTHGINYLENRFSTLIVGKTNMNDVVLTIGNPHSKSLKNDNIWFYFERSITRGSMHKLGQNILKENNTAQLSFNKFGVLKEKKFFNKKNMKNLKYSKKSTVNSTKNQSSFINGFMQSIKQKMYGNRKKN